MEFKNFISLCFEHAYVKLQSSLLRLTLMWKIVIYYPYLRCKTCPESKQFSYLVTSLFARFICLVFVGLSGFFFSFLI